MGEKREMIGVIIPANMKYSPYVEYYIAKLKSQNIEYEIISWNRQKIKEKVNYSFDFPVKDSNRIKVYLGYMLYSIYVKHIIKKRKYTSLVVFTIAGALSIKSLLKTTYKNKYILDIRDDSPVVKYFHSAFNDLCRNAYKIVVSSPAFFNWIPREDIVICHNCSKETIENEMETTFKTSYAHRNIVFAGMMLEEEINIELIEKVSNNSIYQFYFIGTESSGKKKIEDYVTNEHISNVFFKGIYEKKDVTSIYRRYGTYANCIRKNTKVNREALPNKLYDAAIAGIPTIAMKHNLAIAYYLKKYKIGILLDSIDNVELNLKLSEFEKNEIETGQFFKNRKKFLSDILKDIVNFEKDLTNFYLKYEK